MCRIGDFTLKCYTRSQIEYDKSTRLCGDATNGP